MSRTGGTRDGRLVTASCTTGWLDWVHSELWLCDDGLLVVRLDLRATRAHGRGPTVGATLRRRPVGRDEPGMWIGAEEVVGASGRHGRKADRLSLELRDGTERKLLWLAVDRADVPLREALGGWGVPVRWR